MKHWGIEIIEKNTEASISWYNWLINYVPEIVKKWSLVLKSKLWVFLKQEQPGIIVNQESQK